MFFIYIMATVCPVNWASAMVCYCFSLIRVCILVYIIVFCSKVFSPFQKKLTIDDETQFCSEEVLAEVLKSKVCPCTCI